MRMRILLAILCLGVVSVSGMVRATVGPDPGPPPPGPYYYDDGYYDGYWYGPGWYWGIYINNEDTYWRHYRGPHRRYYYYHYRDRHRH